MARTPDLPKRRAARRRPVPDRRAGALLLGAGVLAAGCAVLAPLAPVGPLGSGLAAPLAGLGLVLVLVALCVLTVARRKAARVEAGLGWISGLHLCPTRIPGHGSVALDEAARPESETLALRTLRAQVRTLEQALDQERRHYTPVAGEDAAGAGFRRDVVLTIRALAGRTAPEESGRHTLGRISAAIERLEAGDGFDRPVLAPAPAPTVVRALPAVARVQVAPVQVAEPVAAPTDLPTEPHLHLQPLTAEPVAEPVVQQVTEPVVQQFTEPIAGPVVEQAAPETRSHVHAVPHGQAADHPTPHAADHAPTLTDLTVEDLEATAADAAPAPAAPQVVLPVPPMMTETQTPRGRRWFRRNAA